VRSSNARQPGGRGHGSTSDPTVSIAPLAQLAARRLHGAGSGGPAGFVTPSPGDASLSEADDVPGPPQSGAPTWPLEFFDLMSSPESARGSAHSYAKATPTPTSPSNNSGHGPNNMANAGRPARKLLAVAKTAGASSSGASGYRRKRQSSPPKRYKWSGNGRS